jgi:hypothetical protein
MAKKNTNAATVGTKKTAEQQVVNYRQQRENALISISSRQVLVRMMARDSVTRCAAAGLA